MPISAVVNAPVPGRNILVQTPWVAYTRVWVSRFPADQFEEKRFGFVDFGLRFPGGDYYQVSGNALWYSGIVLTNFELPPPDGGAQLEIAIWTREPDIDFFWELSGEP